MVVVTQGQLEELILAGKPVDNADLSAIDWTDLPDGALHARHCVFRDAHLTDAELAGGKFESCTFERAWFGGANFTDALFSKCSFFDADSRKGCDFSRADFDGATFENCNLATAKFGLASLFDTSFRQCKAAGADFEDARFAKSSGRVAVSRVRFIGTQLDMSSFRQARLDDCILSECSLRQADLRQVTLSSADLRGSDLSEANLNGAILDNADLRDATLLGLDVTRLTSFEGVKVSADQLIDLVRPLGIRVFPRGR
ncbi:pentapeptide repeat-containing protein [Pelagibacterium montanilacus]|uniref:pentapeptide repeat-containing protein n=1 Tax=Pelagibacterium montanilacus TaxID=2185280 RepID=UPI000F8D0D3C|nr:pentapeptide repeat-containing protein [Pelagibacterium montanilacus]